MANETLYLKLEQNIEVREKEVFLKDIGKMVCEDEHILAKAKALKVYSFKDKDEKTKNRKVISALKLIEQLQTLSKGLTVEILGETDVVVEYVKVKKKKPVWLYVKIAFVCLVCFFGTSFTIMAFHNDVGINELFTKLYMMIIGGESQGFTILEISYSIGLASGIIVFFNHIGKRDITKDPTPIEVAMRQYEKDVNTTLVETSDREGKTIDVS